MDNDLCMMTFCEATHVLEESGLQESGTQLLKSLESSVLDFLET